MSLQNQDIAVKRKKVLFLITKATWGGAQRYVYDIATHLDKNKFEPHVAFGTSGKLADDLKRAGVETHEISALGRDIAIFSDIRSFFQIRRCIKDVGPDILHLNSSKAAALGALAGRMCGVPKIIFTAHGWPFKEERGVIARRIIRFISRLTASLSHEVIVVSKSDLELGKRMDGVAGKITYINIGMESPDFLSRDQATSELSIQTTSPRVVTIAELTANKGIKYAIEAVSELARHGFRMTYFIIGDGEERARLEALAKGLDIAKRVHFLGFVPDAAKYLRAFDAFLLPSVKEGMPYVLLEAAYAKLPIVTTTVVDPVFISSFSGICGVEPKHPSELAGAIEMSLSRDAKRPEAGEMTAFSMESFVEKTSALY